MSKIATGTRSKASRLRRLLLPAAAICAPGFACGAVGIPGLDVRVDPRDELRLAADLRDEDVAAIQDPEASREAAVLADEALAIENANPYGNAASVFTQNGGYARYVIDHASAGMVGVNVGVPVPREPFSFGGWNESKFGVGDITGKSSIEFWTRLKKSTVKWNPEAGINWMS